MTSRPRLFTEANYLNGFAAVLLFAVLAAVFVGAGFPFPEGFGDASITAGIGYALFDMVDQAAYESESFLVAFEIVDVVLVAALVGAVMLARREDDESLAAALADGGRRLRDALDNANADGDAGDGDSVAGSDGDSVAGSDGNSVAGSDGNSVAGGGETVAGGEA